MAILISLNIIFKKHITMKKLIFSFIVVATAILVSCNEEFEELTTIDIPNYRDGVYSGDNLTFTVDGEPRTVNSVTISSRQVGNDTLYSDNLKKHYLSYKIPCSGVISRPAASTSCRSFFITSAGIHLRSTLTVRTRLRLRTMSIGA